MIVELNIFDISKQLLDNEDICEIKMIEGLAYDTFIQLSCEDPLKACLTLFDCNLDIEKINWGGQCIVGFCSSLKHW